MEKQKEWQGMGEKKKGKGQKRTERRTGRQMGVQE